MRKGKIPIYLLFLLALLNGCGVLDDIESPIIGEGTEIINTYSNGQALSEGTLTQDVYVDNSLREGEKMEEAQLTESQSAEASHTDKESQATVLPTCEAVETARATVLEGMSEETIERLTENIKVANLAMERAYLNDNIFERLCDKEDLYWNYIDQKGEIQIGWDADGNAIMEYNRFDADNFIALMEDMAADIDNAELLACMEQLIQNMEAAKETHDVEYVRAIYELLHDMDYYLLRYGPEDVAKYVNDVSLICTYYGTLPFYEGE